MDTLASADPLAQRFEMESADPAWASRTEPAISNLFDIGDFAGTRLVYHSCKSTVCRVEVDHDSSTAAQGLLLQLLTQAGDDFPSVSTQLIDDAYGLRSVVMLGGAD